LLGLSSLVGLIVAKQLGAEDRGIFAIYFAWFLIALGIGEAGLGSALTMLSAMFPKRVGEINRQARSVFMLLGLLAACGLFLVYQFAVPSESTRTYIGFFFCLLLPLASLAGVSIFILQGNHPKKWNISRTTQPVSYLILILVLVFFHQVTLWSISIAYGISLLVILVAGNQFVYRLKSESQEDESSAEIEFKDFHLYKELRRHGRRSLLPTIVSTLSGRVDVVIVGITLSAAYVGEYAVAFTLASATMVVATSRAMHVLPDVARITQNGSQAKVVDSVKMAIRGAVKFTIFASVMITVVGFVLANYFLGVSYQNVGKIVLIMAFGQPALAISLVISAMFKGLGQSHYTLMSEFGGLIVTIIGIYVLSSGYGVFGAAVGLVVGLWWTAMSYVLRFNKYAKS